jgi:hypothetical protein
LPTAVLFGDVQHVAGERKNREQRGGSSCQKTIMVKKESWSRIMVKNHGQESWSRKNYFQERIMAKNNNGKVSTSYCFRSSVHSFNATLSPKNMFENIQHQVEKWKSTNQLYVRQQYWPMEKHKRTLTPVPH